MSNQVAAPMPPAGPAIEPGETGVRGASQTDAQADASEFVLLRDGGQVLLRPYVESDQSAVLALYERLSPESRLLRFHSAGTRIDAQAIQSATAGHAIVAERDGAVVGLASYVHLRAADLAEMSLAVDEEQRGRGVGTVLFERLARDGRRDGLRRLLALLMAENVAMMDLLLNLGFHLTRRSEGGEIEVTVDLQQDPGYVAQADARLHVAASASLQPLFAARTVAVVGASRRPGSIGHALFNNLLSGGFTGTVYPVNPSATSVCAVRAYPNVAAIPEHVDLAIIVVPASAVLAVTQECLSAGVRAIVVISAGFAEVSAEGRRLQDELLRMCRSRGARLVGPNCMGVLVNHPDGAMNATFAPTLPPAGNVAISSQSGALGIAILDHARQLGIGVSSFVSIGNKADLSSNDLLERWEDDPATHVILLYLESFGNPRRFARVARRVSTRKPIIAVKGGRSQAGQRAAASHTAALAGSDVAVEALFKQSGVLRCDTLEELFDVAALLSNQPLPGSNRVGVITNAGGLGILCADACEANGLHVAQLAEGTQAALRALLPAEASVGNPVDMLASSPAENYGRVLQIMLADPTVDAVIVLFIPPLVTNAADVADALLAACTPAPAKPVLTCFAGGTGVPPSLQGAVSLPSYRYPESAARALGHAAAYSAWLRRPAGKIEDFADIDAVVVRDIVDRALQREERPWLTPDEVTAVLQAYGIPMPIGTIATSPEEAAEACRRIGAPVAVKLVSRQILHKSDVGGVYLNVESPAAAAEAYRAIAAALDAHGHAGAMDGALVQPMLTGGVECLVGVVTDPLFGPLIAFGLGGVTAEAMADVAFRVHPLTDLDADELIDSVKVARLLRGYRGSTPSDVPALRTLLLRLSQLVEDVPEIAELDINPVIVRPAGQGVWALDARLRLTRR